MAEQAIRDALAVDHDQDGVPDLLKTILGGESFGNGKDNWRNRRMLIIAIAAVMLVIMTMVAIAWMVATLAGQKIDANNADLGSAMFWGAGATLGSAAGAYLGTATWDHASQRRASISAAEKIGLRAEQQNAPPPTYQTVGYPSPYSPQNSPYPATNPVYAPNTSVGYVPESISATATGQPGDPAGGF